MTALRATEEEVALVARGMPWELVSAAPVWRHLAKALGEEEATNWLLELLHRNVRRDPLTKSEYLLLSTYEGPQREASNAAANLVAYRALWQSHGPEQARSWPMLVQREAMERKLPSAAKTTGGPLGPYLRGWAPSLDAHWFPFLLLFEAYTQGGAAVAQALPQALRQWGSLSTEEWCLLLSSGLLREAARDSSAPPMWTLPLYLLRAFDEAPYPQ